MASGIVILVLWVLFYALPFLLPPFECEGDEKNKVKRFLVAVVAMSCLVGGVMLVIHITYDGVRETQRYSPFDYENRVFDY